MVKIVNTVNIARAVLLLPVVTVQGTSCYTTVLQLTRQSVFSCLTRASCFVTGQQVTRFEWNCAMHAACREKIVTQNSRRDACRNDKRVLYLVVSWSSKVQTYVGNVLNGLATFREAPACSFGASERPLAGGTRMYLRVLLYFYTVKNQ